MHILAINGSPRDGNTARVLEALQAALPDDTVEILSMKDLRVEGCVGCLKCQADVEHFVCHQAGDDAAMMLEKVKAADVVIYATPLYGHSYTGQMKQLMDRHSSLVKWVGGPNPHVISALEGKPLGLVTTCGGPAANNAEPLLMMFDKFCAGAKTQAFGKYVFEFCPGNPEGYTPKAELIDAIAADIVELKA